MLEKKTFVSQIEIVQNGTVQVRTSVCIYDNGEKISETYYRKCIQPGEDYSNEEDRVRAICTVTHTPNVVAAFEANNA